MNTILLQKSCDLYRHFEKLILQFPKKDRYGLGLKTENSILRLIEFIITAEQTVPVLKCRALIDASVKSETIKILLRLAMEKRLIKETNYFALSEKLIEIGKMIGGWRRSLQR